MMRLTTRALTIAVAAVALYRFAWLPWHANLVLAEVESRSRAALASGYPVRTAVFARRNLAELQEVAPATRDDANYYMLYAANAAFLNELDLAAQTYTSALENADHRPEIYYERGLIYMRQGKVEAAVADLTHAARFNPMVVYDLTGDLQARVAAAVKQ